MGSIFFYGAVMSDDDVPLDNLQEHMHHEVRTLDPRYEEHKTQKFVLIAALIASILSVFTAISASMASNCGNNALMEQMKSSDQWGYYQAKGIKASMDEGKMYFAKGAKALYFAKKIASYKKEQVSIKIEATRLEAEVNTNLRKNTFYSRAVTFFQIAIALTAIAILAKRREFLALTLVLSILGIYFWFFGFLLVLV